MKKTYSQLLDEIDQLKERAEEARRQEVELVIARIRELITFYGLTEEDLGFRKKAEKAATPVPAPAVPKKKRKSRYTERPLAGPPGKR